MNFHIIATAIKVQRWAEKTVPIEYYVEEEISDLPPQHTKFKYRKFWLSELNITEENGDEIAAQCRKAFEQNADRLAREVPTKIPENWAGDEVRFKKEKFLMENYTASLMRLDGKLIARFPAIFTNANASAPGFNYFHIERDCVYNLKEKKVEKIRITFWPELSIPFD